MHEGRLETGPSCTVSRKQHFRCSSGDLSLRVSIIINVSIVQRTPTSTIKTSSDPTSNFQLPRLPRPAPNVQRSTSNVRTFDVRRPMSNVQTSNVQNVQRSSVQRPNVQRPTSNVQRSTSNVPRSHGPTVPRSNGPTVQRPTSQCSTCNLKRSTSDVQGGQ